MNPFARILAIVRIFIAELGVVAYLASTGIFVGTLTLIYFLFGLADATAGPPGSVNFPDDAFEGLFMFAGLLSAIIFTTSYLRRWFKEEDRGISFLSLPASWGERFGAVLVFGWLFVPLLCFAPLILLSFFAKAIVPISIALPSIAILPEIVWQTWLIHVGFSTVYLMPVIISPKRVGVGVVLLIIGFSVYVAKLRASFDPGPERVPLSENAFWATDVVGMYESETLLTASPAASFVFQPHSHEDFPGLVVFMAALALTLAAGLALRRKTI
ncbi:hypothetical protein [Neolewinella antarctica]|uniref:ABC transporter permease n=1 Tax=Neolewinella antarctica TaxID=442734 RepID=A0ABX0X5X8_9BACT|nr:hypothetical protein [Neolewinella antarctica]NJC24609.1 hypothetical protein [Neolewinella antarctica]